MSEAEIIEPIKLDDNEVTVPFPKDSRKLVFAREYLKTADLNKAWKTTGVGEDGRERGNTKWEWLRQIEESGLLDTLRRQMIVDTRITLKQHLDDLKDLRDEARANGKYGPAIAAEIARGRAAGLYDEKRQKEDEFDPGTLSLEDINKQLTELVHLRERQEHGLTFIGNGGDRSSDSSSGGSEE
jgi:hypothetical protein